MTTLVIGGTGFIGSYVVRELLAAGEEVACYNRTSDLRLLRQLISAPDLDSVHIIHGDVTDSGALLRAVRDHRITKIVHLAALLTGAASTNVQLAERVNVGGTVNVFEAASLLSVDRLVWMSSIGVFGPRSVESDDRIRNDSLTDPQTFYGSCKVFAEALSRQYAVQYGMTITGIRLSTVYGYGKQFTLERGSGLTWLGELIDKPALGIGPCVVPGAGRLFDFLHADDAARAIILALKAENTQGRSYIVHGDTRSVDDAVAYVRSYIPEVEISLVPSGPMTYRRCPFDAASTLADLGYAPRVSMEAGITKTIGELRRNQAM